MPRVDMQEEYINSYERKVPVLFSKISVLVGRPRPNHVLRLLLFVKEAVACFPPECDFSLVAVLIDWFLLPESRREDVGARLREALAVLLRDSAHEVQIEPGRVEIKIPGSLVSLRIAEGEDETRFEVRFHRTTGIKRAHSLGAVLVALKHGMIFDVFRPRPPRGKDSLVAREDMLSTLRMYVGMRLDAVEGLGKQFRARCPAEFAERLAKATADRDFVRDLK